MAAPHLVILSGAYCSPDIVAEFGKLPPAFLPAGNARLYTQQIALARALGASPSLTIPADFEPDPWDMQQLEAEDVRIIRSPLSLRLAEAVEFVLEVLQPQGPLFLLHGDTLVEGDGLQQPDILASHVTDDYYAWADLTRGDEGALSLHTGFGDGHSAREVACGYFTFSDPALLRRMLIGQPDFVEAVNAYGRQKPLHAVAASYWYDFGHLPLLFQSKRAMLVSRAFNSVESDGIAVTKRSRARDKLESEIAWYRALPEALRVYTPQFLGGNLDGAEAHCRLEYLYQPTLAELFVFGRLPRYVWRKILASCAQFLEDCRSHAPHQDDPASDPIYAEHFFAEVIAEKSRQRLLDFCQSRGLDIAKPARLNGRDTPPLSDVVEDLLARVPPTRPEHIRLWHGDFFFGNTFYDFRAARIRVVDPRGQMGPEEPALYGDWRYDVAKLAHSIYGRYDLLLAGHARFRQAGDTDFYFDRPETGQAAELERDFAQMSLAGQPALSEEIRALVALLFLSMLPLHGEDPRRQSLFLANGLLLHREIAEAA